MSKEQKTKIIGKVILDSGAEVSICYVPGSKTSRENAKKYLAFLKGEGPNPNLPINPEDICRYDLSGFGKG